MDPANALEAVREAKLDADEGADIVMVKPALPYLDVIRRVKDATGMPVAAYNVSGEYAMIKAAAAQGLLDERAAVLEALTGIRRAGADIVITYHAKDVAQWLVARAKVRSRRDGSAVPLDETDKKLLNLMQGSFALRPDPFAGVAELAGIPEDEVMERVQYLLDKRIIREVTPIFDTRALGYSCDARGREGRRRATRTARRSSSTRTPASRTTTCATTSSTSGSRSPSSPTRSSGSTARST